ncbi:MAG: YciI family protein, partial [Chloroflexota bacterium]|nr:YciI family protein [Chloroflexota bacterium]
MPQYVLMLLEDESWEERSEEDRKRAYAAINAWVDDVRNKGIMKGGEELQSKRTATTVRRKNGAMSVTEGPFIESKEHVGGFM